MHIVDVAARAPGARFYVYLYRDPMDASPIYVGKGSHRDGDAIHSRAKHHWQKKSCNPVLNVLTAKWRAAGLEPLVEVVAWLEREELAFELERHLILQIGRRDHAAGPLCNLTDGGDGPGGRVISEETRRRLRESHLGQQPSNLDQLRRQNIGRKHSAEQIAKRVASRRARGWFASPGDMAAKIAAARRGKSLSKEHRQKISATLMSPEINQKLHAARPWQGFIQRRKP